MNKEEFCKYIRAIESQIAKDRKYGLQIQEMFDTQFASYNTGFSYEYFVNLLEEIMDDQEAQWIDYFVWELDFGKLWTKNSCNESDGTVIDISTPEKLYDYLVKCSAESTK